MDEFNMIWTGHMYGMIHGIRMMNLAWFWKWKMIDGWL